MTDAVRYFERALKVDDNNVHAWNMLGMAQQALHRPEEAIVSFRKVHARLVLSLLAFEFESWILFIHQCHYSTYFST